MPHEYDDERLAFFWHRLLNHVPIGTVEAIMAEMEVRDTHPDMDDPVSLGGLSQNKLQTSYALKLAARFKRAIEER